MSSRLWELPPARPEVAPFIARLPERQRLVVFLRYYADLDYRSIGEARGIGVGTVAATLAAAHATSVGNWSRRAKWRPALRT